MVLLHVAVVLWFFELLQGLNDVGEHFYFLLLGEFGVEVVGLERFFEERQHDQIGDEKIVVPLSGLWLQHEIFVEPLIVDDPLHAFEVAVVELRC